MAENTVNKHPPANLSNPSITHSWALKIKLTLLFSKKVFTLSGPNLTIFPVPFGSLTKLGWIPNSLSLSVGSLHKISTTSYCSTDETSCTTSRGLRICST